jgi:pyruvate kinase
LAHTVVNCKLNAVRHTKIVATLGPASSSDAMLDELIAAGVDIFRLNFSHGTHETHAATYARVRAAAERGGRPVAILQDLSGPKIRTGRLENGAAIPLTPGQELRIATGDFVGAAGRVSTTYADLARSVRPGQRLLLDDGRIVLKVEESDGAEIRTTVVHGSSLSEHKGINAPGVALPSIGLTAKDRSDLEFGLALGVDMVAMSFVQTGRDLDSVRSAMRGAGRASLPLIAKIERPEAVDHLDDVLDHCDAVMVARGDLGLELPFERVPRVQKEVTTRARARGLPVILATQVLESMRSEPMPTRAEVSDAANAVHDGVDAIMLAGETAAGAYPVQAVKVLDRIIRDAELLPPVAVDVTGKSQMHAGHGRALCDAALTLASHAEANAIVAVTREGNTARVLSSLRPEQPIVAATGSLEIARRLTLYRSVHPMLVELASDTEAEPRRVAPALIAVGYAEPDTNVVFVSISQDLGRPFGNYLKLHRL